MWRVVPASVVGTSHERTGTPCQDACDLLRLNAGGEDVLLLAIADGAGSAALSHLGSSEAVSHLLAVVRRTYLDMKSVTREQTREWMQEVLNHLAKVAERENAPMSQFACTLLLALVARNGAIFAQIGDGGWVVEKDGELIPGTWPQIGQFVNITTFITTESALDAMQFTRLEGEIGAVAGFTYGLKMLALNFAGHQAHAPFFSPMFDAVRNCDDETSLIAPLRAFLASEPVTTRTDDDKTLVLACWRDPESAPNALRQ